MKDWNRSWDRKWSHKAKFWINILKNGKKKKYYNKTWKSYTLTFI